MRAKLVILIAGLLCASLAGCAGSKFYEGPGRYMVRGPGYRIEGGPYPDLDSCHSAIPSAQHGRTYVCVYMPADVRPNIWKKSVS